MLKKNRNLKSIIISGYFGFGNCGDEAILMAMIQQLSQIVSKENIVVLSQNPKKTKMLYGVNSVFRLNPFLIFRQMKKCAVFISGGGGLLQDVSGKGLSIIYYLSLILLARLFKIPNVIYGQGIGPIRREINRKILRLILSKTNLIIVRDEQSQLLLQQIGIEKESVLVYADPSFLLKKEQLSSEIEKYYFLGPRYGKSINKMTIGVIIRNCKEIEQDYNQKVLQLAKVADHLITKYQSRLIFIPFQIDNDLTLLNDVIKQMKNSSVDCLEREINPAQMLSFFSELSLTIGMRFHAILFSTINNNPFIAIDYDPKVRNYVNSLELPELLLNLNQLTIKYIDYKLQYINDNWEKIKSILDTNTKQFQGKAEAGMKELLSFIKERIL
ncbi:MAG TPA: polysaccharide pyruvyl transferase CsaB [Atribacterota bacterium]|nr:polysaccharide pyruvyl transferase CsaB [Atribacterota bacterium]